MNLTYCSDSFNWIIPFSTHALIHELFQVISQDRGLKQAWADSVFQGKGTFLSVVVHSSMITTALIVKSWAAVRVCVKSVLLLCAAA